MSEALANIDRRLIDQGRVMCLCGRRATGTTPGGEPECDDLSCHAAEEIERERSQLARALEVLREIARERHVNAHGSIEAAPSYAADIAQKYLDSLGGQS